MRPARNIILTGADLEPKSHSELSGPNSIPAVSQVFDAKGADAFAKFTTEHTGEINGIVLDDAVISAPSSMSRSWMVRRRSAAALPT